jgi:tyrosyl-tRNA synthetase
MQKKHNKKDEIEEVLVRGVEEIVVRERLEKLLLEGKPLRIKYGIDPTGPKIHIGRACTLWKLRAFQDLGHKVVLIIGTATAQIGDPSDKLSKRPMLEKTQVEENLKGYLAQIGKIVNMRDPELFETRQNGEWLANLTFGETAQLAESFSVQQMLARRNFKERWEKQEEISLRELLYPLMQGYDSVAVKADVEIGGADQLFNLHAGRTIQAHYGQPSQNIMTLKMLPGLDGRKMSTSWGNIIAIVDEPNDMYGRVMSMSDGMMPEYFELACPLMPLADIKKTCAALRDGSLPPRDAKMRLAREIVRTYHGDKEAENAEEYFVNKFQKKEIPKDIPVIEASGSVFDIVETLVGAGVCESKSDAKRLITQGGVEIGDKTVKDLKIPANEIPHNTIMRAGKRHIFRIVKPK